MSNKNKYILNGDYAYIQIENKEYFSESQTKVDVNKLDYLLERGK